ncbi:MAG TPA: 2-oxo acid dehydrogenase subunit E2 [Prolixibacteraceae bacterium]|jgi:pyruvate dehydrogenase E2 component (dihydrolipoamide acetyltransferase)|nr:2-oxo acid dehydrogenase subunit E2 [Bacteroidales bacterium]HNQ36859.1 2-oxo acid dehydrogenase subunit E2 [Prolixibacteraceae bacterium]HPJ79026.1 2-oxo acid dehydrogenase subunit E2 [Prolixibacteraceae bacterium]
MKTTSDLNNEWRMVASAIYKRPVDSKILGQSEVDVTDLEAYIAQKRKSGVKVTLTQVLTLAAARALHDEVPELNVYLRRGKIVSRPSVDAMVSVLLEGSELGSVKVPHADEITIDEMAAFIAAEIKKARGGNENKTMEMKGKLAVIPWPFRSWIFQLVRTFTQKWGFSIPSLGLTPHSFGSFIVSNIGTLGLDLGFPALMPTSNVSFVLILGAVNKKPWVVNDEIVPRKILTLGAALDHRVCDGSHGGRLFRYLKYIIKNPELLDQKPERPAIKE